MGAIVGQCSEDMSLQHQVQDDDKVIQVSPKKKRRAPPANEFEREVRLEEERFAKSSNPHIANMERWNIVKVGKGAAMIHDHQAEINLLKMQIKNVAPSLHPDLLTYDCDDNGARTKFYYETIRKPVDEKKVGEWKGAKYPDKKDPNITWFEVRCSTPS